jgi:hypothetical protein
MSNDVTDAAPGGGGLRGVKLSLTGFDDPTEREEIAETVQRLGGHFCAQLERQTCTHLLVADGLPKDTDKMVAARKWGGIALVPLAWLHACVTAAAWVPETSFLLSPLLPAVASGAQGASQKEVSARRSGRAENTVLCVLQQGRAPLATLSDTALSLCAPCAICSTGGVSAWEHEVAQLSWQEPPAWDALHLSGFRIAFRSNQGDAATRCACVSHVQTAQSAHLHVT